MALFPIKNFVGRICLKMNVGLSFRKDNQPSGPPNERWTLAGLFIASPKDLMDVQYVYEMTVVAQDQLHSYWFPSATSVFQVKGPLLTLLSVSVICSEAETIVID